MKVGDLVELSFKGKRIIWCHRFKEKTGIVIDMQPQENRLHNIQVSWLGRGSWWIHRNYIKTVSRG